MMAAEGCTPDNVLVMPHPNFRDAYPDDVTDEAARRHLGFSGDQTVFAFLGAMRPYKGLDVLADAFVQLRESGLPTGLILAGRAGGPGDVARIASAFAPAASAIRLLPRHIDDCAVQYVMRAADYVVLPYHAILTSGAMMLALGFSRPVIVPALPTLLEVVRPGRDCLAFRPGDADTLHDAMLTAAGHDGEQRAVMRRAARATAEATTFAQLARALIWWAGVEGSGGREARAA
jgi:glycosyltransferase involved in cell wall biosynthesis